MNIIIAGGGKVGQDLLRKLSAEGHALTLIDTRQQVLESTVPDRCSRRPGRA